MTRWCVGVLRFWVFLPLRGTPHSTFARCVVCNDHIDVHPLDHAGQLLDHMRSHWEEANANRRTALVLEYLYRGATNPLKTQGDRTDHYYTSAVLLHRLGYIVPWERYPSWVINSLDPENARTYPL